MNFTNKLNNMNNNRKMTTVQKYNLAIFIATVIYLTNLLNNGGFTL